MKHFFTFLLFISLSAWANAQLAPGKWQHLIAFSNPSKVVDAGERIYFATEGGLFYVDKNDNSINTYSKIDGLSEASIRTISYNETTGKLIVAYQNSTIDILSEDGTVFPLLDIKRKNVPGNQYVNSMFHQGKLCYLACGFGIVVLDIEKREVKDTYIIGEKAAYLNVNQVTILNDKIYAATASGLREASMSSNLLDYHNWQKIDESRGLPDTEYLFTMSNAGTVYAISKSADNDYGNTIYYLYEDGRWYIKWWEIYAIYDMKFVNDFVVVASDYNIVFYNPSSGVRSEIRNYGTLMETGLNISPKSVMVDKSGILWLTDSNYGAIRYNNVNFERIIPSGPKDNSMFNLRYSDGNLWIAKGGVDKTWGNTFSNPLFQKYDGKTWKYFDRSNLSGFTGITDILYVLPVPGETDRQYVVAYGHGLLEMKDGSIVNYYSHKNSNIERINVSDMSFNYVRIGGIAFDKNKNLWMTNSMVQNNLHCLTIEGNWLSFNLPELAGNYNMGKVLVSSDDNIWMVVPTGKTSGLYIMSSDGSQKRHLSVQSYFSNGQDERNVAMNDVYDIAEDHDGTIWVATSQGVTTYSKPYAVFSEEKFYAYQPALDLNDGIYHPLLEKETVKAIAIDGANRKWFGTSSSGVYLISADGQHELEHFTTDNSPLITNEISSLAYDGDNGILYIGSQAGLVAYFTNSKNATKVFQDVYAYPNPVRPEYSGDIYITGLVSDTNVKITTITGRLVYETTSLGGRAVWPGTDLAGNRVHTGVYMVFCASKDGSQSEATKILFIR